MVHLTAAGRRTASPTGESGQEQKIARNSRKQVSVRRNLGFPSATGQAASTASRVGVDATRVSTPTAFTQLELGLFSNGLRFNPASNRSRIIPPGKRLRRGTYLNPRNSDEGHTPFQQSRARRQMGRVPVLAREESVSSWWQPGEGRRGPFRRRWRHGRRADLRDAHPSADLPFLPRDAGRVELSPGHPEEVSEWRHEERFAFARRVPLERGSHRLPALRARRKLSPRRPARAVRRGRGVAGRFDGAGLVRAPKGLLSPVRRAVHGRGEATLKCAG